MGIPPTHVPVSVQLVFESKGRKKERGKREREGREKGG